MKVKTKARKISTSIELIENPLENVDDDDEEDEAEEDEEKGGCAEEEEEEEEESLFI